MIAVTFMGSTLVTPLYVLYRQAFGFSAITLTLIYAAYVIGNLGCADLPRPALRPDRPPPRRLAGAGAGCDHDAGVPVGRQARAWLYVGRILTGFVNGLAAGAGTAWLAELDDDRGHATRMATVGNFAGLAAGPLLGGVLAEYAPWPLHLSFIVYLVIIAVSALLVARTRETVAKPVRRLAEVSLRPRLGVTVGHPRAIHRAGGDRFRDLRLRRLLCGTRAEHDRRRPA